MRAVVAFALALLAGCTGHAIRRDPHEGKMPLTVHNYFGVSVCSVFVFPVGETREGDNQLPANAELRNGDRARLWFVPGDYQVRAAGCPRATLEVRGYTTNVRLNMDGNVVLYREDDANSSSEATRVAHENENTYLVPAKMQLGNHSTRETK